MFAERKSTPSEICATIAQAATGKGSHMLSTHRKVAIHRGYTILQREPGFEFTPVMMAKVASHIVYRDDDGWTLFAFMYSLLDQIGGTEIDEDGLLESAVALIRSRIDAGDLNNGAELTFEWRSGEYVEASSPRWWIPAHR